MDLKFLTRIFIRRLPYFLIVAVTISVVSIIIAQKLPPTYISQMKLIVDSPQIPRELAASTVATPASEQLQIIEQRMLTREVLLDIARRINVLPNLSSMTPDAIVASMRSRTGIRRSSGRNQATLMTIDFESPSAEAAAGVLNEYMTLIQQIDIDMRRGRASQTLEFFEQEVLRLGSDLANKRAAILDFKLKNSDALPESLDFRLSQQTQLQEREVQLQRDISGLEQQRERLIKIFESTGQVGAAQARPKSADEVRLEQLRAELVQDLAIFSRENPRVQALEARIKSVEETLAKNPAGQTEVQSSSGNPLLDLQLAEIDTRIEVLQEQQLITRQQLSEIVSKIGETPANSIRLEELQLDHENIQTQYKTAVDRLASASTGERIELLSRGQKISIIEPPSVPNAPAKPNRTMIAGGGTFLGIMAGFGLVALLEFLNKSIRRPEDLVAKLQITPLATVPYIRTRGQKFRQRSMKLVGLAAILVGIPALMYGIDQYYQPLDQLAGRVIDMLGIQ